MSTQPATEHDLLEIWQGVLAHFIEYMKTTPPEKRKVGMLDSMVRFLKMNGVTVDSTQAGAIKKGLSGLDGADLPFQPPK